MLPHEQHRPGPWCRDERTQQSDADAEFPVLAVGETGEKAACCLHRRTAEQKMSTIREQVANQQAFQNIAGRWPKRIVRSDESADAGGCDGIG